MAGNVPKKKIYVCFDIKNDSRLLDFVKAQAKQPDSPYLVVDYSKPWQPPEKEWKEKLKKTISLVEIFMIMVGKKTFRDTNALDEIDLAYNLGKPMFQFCDPKAQFAECKPIPKAGKLYKWEWDNMIIAFNKLSLR